MSQVGQSYGHRKANWFRMIQGESNLKWIHHRNPVPMKVNLLHFSYKLLWKKFCKKHFLSIVGDFLKYSSKKWKFLTLEPKGRGPLGPAIFLEKFNKSVFGMDHLNVIFDLWPKFVTFTEFVNKYSGSSYLRRNSFII